MSLFKISHGKLSPITQTVEIKIQNIESKKTQRNEDQFLKTCKNFLLISQLFLSAPMGIHKSRKYLKARDLIFYRIHIVWCLGVYSFLAFCFYNEYTLSNIELSSVEKPLYFSEYFVYSIHLLELIRMINFRREMFWKFQIFILDFDRTLMDMKIRINYGELQRFLRHHMALVLLHFVSCVTIGYFYIAGNIDKYLRNIAVYLLPNVIIHISMIQYYVLLFIVYKRAENLYFLLESLLNTISLTDIWSVRHQLHLIRSLYGKLDEFTKCINDHFSISILLVYFGSFINISINIFLLYKSFHTWSISNPSWAVYSLAWTLMHSGKMFLILYYNQNVQNMVNNFNLVKMSINRVSE